MTESQPRGRAVLLSPFFFPEPISTGRFNSALVEGLRDAGMECTVIASHPLYPDWVPAQTNRELPGISIVRGGGGMRYPSAPLFRRIALELWYLCYVAYEAPRHRESASIVLGVMPPILFVPLAKWLFGKTPFVGIVHDLQSVFVGVGASASRRLLGGLLRKLERRALHSCDRIVFLSASMAGKAIEMHGLDPERCVVRLPFTTMPGSGGNGNALHDTFASGHRHVVYAGALGEKQNPEGLLEFFRYLAAAKNGVVCHCFSRGPVFDALKVRYGSELGIVFHDLVRDEDLAELMERSDIHLVPQLFGTSEGALPSKLPNLIAAGVPILAICDEQSEVGDIVRDAEAGASVHSWKPEFVAAAALDLLQATAGDSRDARRARSRAYVKRRFNRENLIDDILGLAQRGPR